MEPSPPKARLITSFSTRTASRAPFRLRSRKPSGNSSAFSGSGLLKPLQELDLPGMVEVVRRGAADEPDAAPVEGFRLQACDRSAQLAVLGDQERDVGLPPAGGPPAAPRAVATSLRARPA